MDELCRVREEISSEVTLTVSSNCRVSIPMLRLNMNCSSVGRLLSSVNIRVTNASDGEMLTMRFPFISTIRSAPYEIYVVSLDTARSGRALIWFKSNAVSVSITVVGRLED